MDDNSKLIKTAWSDLHHTLEGNGARGGTKRGGHTTSPALPPSISFSPLSLHSHRLINVTSHDDEEEEEEEEEAESLLMR